MRLALFSLMLFLGGVWAEEGRAMRELYTDSFQMDVAGWEADWEGKREAVKSRVMLAAGLWPMPEKTPLKAVVHGRVEREDYTIDRVFFESFPGHFVTGSLYLPKPLPEKGMPGILCPHGHWPKGRFMDAGADSAGTKEQLHSGAETFVSGARSPLQARCVHLARMGCAVFHWDTLGNADSIQIADHRSGAQEGSKGSEPGTWGLYSAMADLRLQTNFGLQTWNSVRALDFLESVKGVDKGRIGVTGASGGATQTMMLTAMDDRVKAAFPCVMVSTAMQGGCTCENGHYLRVGQGNVDIAAAAAPRPLGMTTADDWTVAFHTQGFPDLKALYGRIGKPDNVQALFATQFKHNYNQVSRAEMYLFMKRHLGLEKASVQERDFVLSSKEELTVWTGEHAAPAGEKVGNAHEAGLMKAWADLSDAKIKPLLAPKDENQLAESVLVVGEAWRMMVGREMPEEETVTGVIAYTGGLGRVTGEVENLAAGELVGTTSRLPGRWDGRVVVNLSGLGEVDAVSGGVALEIWPKLYLAEAKENPSVKEGTKKEIDSWKAWCGYTYGYNAPLLMRRVHDVLAVLAAVPKLVESAKLKGGMKEVVSNRVDSAKLKGGVKEVVLKGDGEMAAVAGLAAMIAGPEVVQGLEVKPGGFRFAKLTSQWDTGFVPGAVKYGDLPAILGLCAPIKLTVSGEGRMPEVEAMYGAAGAANEVSWGR
jgi:dienelactone hydrolase